MNKVRLNHSKFAGYEVKIYTHFFHLLLLYNWLFVLGHCENIKKAIRNIYIGKKVKQRYFGCRTENFQEVFISTLHL